VWLVLSGYSGHNLNKLLFHCTEERNRHVSGSVPSDRTLNPEVAARQSCPWDDYTIVFDCGAKKPELGISPFLLCMLGITVTPTTGPDRPSRWGSALYWCVFSDGGHWLQLEAAGRGGHGSPELPPPLPGPVTELGPGRCPWLDLARAVWWLLAFTAPRPALRKNQPFCCRVRLSRPSKRESSE